ncbi:putative capsid protein [Rudbeckia flower distortion virus]|uniref:Coat protein n=1 Tax=Rudbeckia flower distortion virus TaxID=587370 RepID=B8Y870_9VIRU|nr:putative capsid protein [Rudbeckia flower distortion virus]ACL36981.1 putative capsid protein [Rudbeckia flower distortion virus]
MIFPILVKTFIIISGSHTVHRFIKNISKPEQTEQLYPLIDTNVSNEILTQEVIDNIQSFQIKTEQDEPVQEKLYGYEDDEEEILVDNSSYGSIPEDEDPEERAYNEEGQGSGIPEFNVIPKNEGAEHYDPFNDFQRNYDSDRRRYPRGHFNFSDLRFPRETNVPLEFQPRSYKNSTLSVLNIDCIVNKAQAIDDWIAATDVMILTNEGLRNNIKNAWAFITHLVSGNITEYINRLNEEQKKKLFEESKDGHDLLRLFRAALYAAFLGIDIKNNPEEAQLKKEENAMWRLNNICISDLCLLDEFHCEFEKYFYQLSVDNQERYLQVYSDKIPGEVGFEHRRSWRERDPSILDTLGGRKRSLDEYIARECTRRLLFKQVKRTAKICCKPNNLNIPGNYGCYPTVPAKNRNKKLFQKKKLKRFKKTNRNSYYKAKPAFRRKFFRKRKTVVKPTTKTADNKAKYCPKGKPNCRCWLCKEEGHYANACPNKEKIDSKQVKLFETIYLLQGFEPIEDDENLSDSDSIYYLTDDEIEDYSSDESESEN